MDKYYILNQVKKIHELSHRCSEYEAAQKKCTGKYIEIAHWIDDTEKEIKEIKKNILESYKKIFYEDVYGKYLIMTHSNDNENSIFLFHITDVGKNWKSIYFKHDLLLVPLGEYLSLTFDKHGKLIRSHYYQKTDEYDPIGSSYFTSNHYYHLIDESFNGWKETTKEMFDGFIQKYISNTNENLDFEDIYNNASEVKINGEE